MSLWYQVKNEKKNLYYIYMSDAENQELRDIIKNL